MRMAREVFAGLVLAVMLVGCGGGGGGGGGVIVPSGIATLADLELSAGPLDQAFQPGQSAYTATVGFLSTATVVTPTTTAAAATVTVNGVDVASGDASTPIPLAVGENSITVVVTAEDGVSTVTYTLSVTREAADQFAQQAYLKASNTGGGDQFGYSIALSGDTLAVGAYREDSSARGVDGEQADDSLAEAGAVYVFTRSGTAWSQQAYLKASNTGSDDSFGYAVVLDGDTLAVGADREASKGTGVNGGDESDDSLVNAGAVYVFTRAGTVWSQQAYVKASNTGSNDVFGWSLALSGDTLAVGAAGEASSDGDPNDDSAPFTGAVYVFIRSGAAWTQQAYLKASNREGDDVFGWSLALADDTLAVGAPREDSNATGIGGDQGSNSRPDSGAVYLFTRSGAAWTQVGYLKAAVTDNGDFLGYSVALSHDTLAAGAPGEDSLATGTDGDTLDNSQSGAGAAYAFQ